VGEFLRARRALVRPEDVGVHPGGSRHVPGLRREEVAMLAGVSTDYYIHLEQGRERRPSPQVIDALARALRLDVDTHRHLRELASPTRAPHRDRAPETDRLLVDLIEQWVATPAMVVTDWLDVVARNPLGDALYAGLPYRDNLARMTFLGDAVKDFVDDWDQLAQCTVATLRSAATHDAHQPELVDLVGELSRSSEPFRRLWSRHDAHRKVSARKRFHHATAGPLTLHLHVMTLPDHPHLQLWIYQPEPGTVARAGATALEGLIPADPGAARPGG
jgi:transcriptional regulator with XRE-family HTH domain